MQRLMPSAVSPRLLWPGGALTSAPAARSGSGRNVDFSGRFAKKIVKKFVVCEFMCKFATNFETMDSDVAIAL